MKLELHLIPQTSFYSNLRNKIGRTEWDKLSRKIRSERNFTCELCGSTNKTHLHEVWEFKKNIQKLVRFECVCQTCHAVHHWGLSEVQGRNMDFLTKHACKVNDCTLNQWHAHLNESFRTWTKRSEKQWKVDVSFLKQA